MTAPRLSSSSDACNALGVLIVGLRDAINQAAAEAEARATAAHHRPAPRPRATLAIAAACGLAGALITAILGGLF